MDCNTPSETGKTSKSYCREKEQTYQVKSLEEWIKNILRELASHVDEIVFISGTNGKTTTSNLIGHTLKANQIEIIHNNEGANMAAGITSAFILQLKKILKLQLLKLMKVLYQEY